MLTPKRIRELSTRRNVKQIAVENFLSTLHLDDDRSSTIDNLYMDAKTYKWNAATVMAIQICIDNFFTKS
jgi:hypothetical protein